MICHRHLAQRNDKQSMTWAPQERITNRPLEKLARQRRTECDMTGSRLPHIYCAVLPVPRITRSCQSLTALAAPYCCSTHPFQG